MAKANRILANFDARISKIEILPENRATKVVMESSMRDALSGRNRRVTIVFSDVAAIDFRINYFDNAIGSEAAGLYQIVEQQFAENLVKEIFERRGNEYRRLRLYLKTIGFAPCTGISALSIGTPETPIPRSGF